MIYLLVFLVQKYNKEISKDDIWKLLFENLDRSDIYIYKRESDNQIVFGDINQKFNY